MTDTGAPSFAAHIAGIERIDGRTSRRRRIVVAVLVVLVLGVTGPLAVRLYLHRLAPASVQVVGTWHLESVDHDGHPSVTAAELGGHGAALEFDRNGQFGMTGGCNTTTGSYHVSSDHLWFGSTGDGALGCGYATPEAERIANAVGVAVNAVLENGADLSTPAADRLDVAARGYVLHYAHA